MKIRIVAIVAFGLLAIPACRHAPPAEPQGPPPPKASEFYPLKVGNRWTYEIRSSGQTVQRSIAIVDEKAGFFVDSTGAELRHDDTGLRDKHRYLLENPVETGRKWLAVRSPTVTERFEITSAGSGCETKAGKFPACVTVESTNEVGQGRRLVIQSTYAKDVGLVSVQTQQIEGSNAPVTVLELELVSFTLAP